MQTQFTHWQFLNKVTFGIESNPLGFTYNWIHIKLHQSTFKAQLFSEAFHSHLRVNISQQQTVPHLTTTSKKQPKTKNKKESYQSKQCTKAYTKLILKINMTRQFWVNTQWNHRRTHTHIFALSLTIWRPLFLLYHSLACQPHLVGLLSYPSM